jgi:hypothetical protein
MSTITVCFECDCDIEREPVRDPAEVVWRGEDAKTWCSPECSQATEDRLERAANP